MFQQETPKEADDLCVGKQEQYQMGLKRYRRYLKLYTLSPCALIQDREGSLSRVVGSRTTALLA